MFWYPGSSSSRTCLNKDTVDTCYGILDLPHQKLSFLAWVPPGTKNEASWASYFWSGGPRVPKMSHPGPLIFGVGGWGTKNEPCRASHFWPGGLRVPKMSHPEPLIFDLGAYTLQPAANCQPSFCCEVGG